MARFTRLTVIAPSIMNSHRQAISPLAPLRLLITPAAIRPEKAPEIIEPE